MTSSYLTKILGDIFYYSRLDSTNIPLSSYKFYLLDSPRENYLKSKRIATSWWPVLIFKAWIGSRIRCGTILLKSFWVHFIHFKPEKVLQHVTIAIIIDSHAIPSSLIKKGRPMIPPVYIGHQTVTFRMQVLAHHVDFPLHKSIDLFVNNNAVYLSLASSMNA